MGSLSVEVGHLNTARGIRVYIECVDLWLLYWSGPWQARWRPIRPSIIKSLPTPDLERLWLILPLGLIG